MRARSLLPTLALAGSLLLPLFNAAGGPVEKNPIGKETVQVAEAHPMYLGSINSGIKTNDSYTDGNFSIVAPLWSTLGADSTLNGGVLFLEPYVSYGEGGEVAASLGLGYRYLFGNQSVNALTNHDGHQAGFWEEGAFIGANVFVDMLDTDSNNQFWQLGVGLEAGTRYVEVRGNYYIPLSDKQLAEEFRTREQFQSTSSQTHQSVSGSDALYATNNAIVEDVLITNSLTTTTRTTTIERLFRRYEEGMEGWDAELAVLVPGLDRYFDLRFIGGYYSFDNQPFGPQQGGTGNVEGWKAGVEIRPVPAVIFTGTWYEDERLTGSDWTAGVQLQMPFEMGDLGDGKGFWDRIGDAFTPRRRHLVERLAEPVHRQNAAVKIANTTEEEETEVSTSVKRVTKVLSQTRTQIIIKDDIIFVNNGAAVGNGIQQGTTQANGADGTAEHPYDTVTEGAVTAGQNSTSSGRLWNVYTQGGTGVEYTGTAVASGSTEFISSFTPIVSPSGKVFGGNTPRPVVNGGISALQIPILHVTAYDFRQGSTGGAILADDVQDLIVRNNLFNVTTNGISIFTRDGVTTNALLEQNVIDVTSPTGIAVSGESYGANSLLDIDIVNNEFVNAGLAGVRLRSEDDSMLIGNVTSNRFLANSMGAGVEFQAYSDSTMQMTVSDNVLSHTNGYGILGRSIEDSTLNATVSNNTLNGANAFGILAEKHGAGTFTIDTLNNVLSGTYTSMGIRYYSAGGVATGGLYGTVQNNVLSGIYRVEGIEFYAYEGLIDADAIGNQLTGTFVGFNPGLIVNGISVRRSLVTGTGQATVDIIGNTLSGTFNGTGILVLTAGAVGAPPALTTVLIDGNQLTGSFGRGIVVDSSSTSGVNARIRNNVLAAGSTYATHGIYIHRAGAGVTNVTEFNDNVVAGTSQRGIYIDRDAGTLTVNGSLDPSFSNSVSNATVNLLQTDGTPSGGFILNGAVITLPQTVP